TVKPASVEYIRRRYENDVYDRAVKELKKRGITVITHVILGLPGESEQDMLDTVRHSGVMGTDGIKLQLLHVLRGTDLEKDYNAGRVPVLSMDRYVKLVRKCIEILPPGTVIHRMTGDGSKKDLIAPLWSADKKAVLNALRKELSE
ncbi:MAG: TIGR01212 family radical SAM protein, partial [Oscillospiraceae bacterium]|nr:TIGR01212 family radical SAM protein [Oscillospiraceae bacterium]